jgi:hypothetical protein
VITPAALATTVVSALHSTDRSAYTVHEINEAETVKARDAVRMLHNPGGGPR